MLRLCLYLFFALSPLIATSLHDFYISYDYGFEFQSLGYYIYNYLPSVFYWMKKTFMDTAYTGMISSAMKTSLVTYSFVLSALATAWVINAKLHNKGPFRDYLKDLPELQKNWLSSDRLGARFSGGRAHVQPQVHNDNHAA